MSKDGISDESRFDASLLLKVNPTVTDSLLNWWNSLSQSQKIMYCSLHPNSDLTKGHLGKMVFPGWDKEMMRRYHKKQADDLKLNMIAELSKSKKDHLKKMYLSQKKLGE